MKRKTHRRFAPGLDAPLELYDFLESFPILVPYLTEFP